MLDPNKESSPGPSIFFFRWYTALFNIKLYVPKEYFFSVSFHDFAYKFSYSFTIWKCYNFCIDDLSKKFVTTDRN